MKYDVNDYFRNYLMFLSNTKENVNIKEDDISTYLRALFNCNLEYDGIIYSYGKIYLHFLFDGLLNNIIKNIYIDLVDNSLNCEIDLQGIVYRVKLVNNKLYYSIYNYKENLNGIYFYETDEVGNTVLKFYDARSIKEKTEQPLNINDANDFMLRVYGFSPDYEESHEYKGMLEFDAAEAFNDLILTMAYEKTIAFMSAINKKTENKLNYHLGKRM